MVNNQNLLRGNSFMAKLPYTPEWRAIIAKEYKLTTEPFGKFLDIVSIEKKI